MGGAEMIQRLKRLYSNFRGFDQTGSAVPMMDGPLKPNTLLDDAPVALVLPQVDNLLAVQGGIACSQGTKLLQLRLKSGSIESPVLNITSEMDFAAPITCLVSDREQGLAIGLDGQGIVIHGGPHDGVRIEQLDGLPLRCPTAAMFLDRDTLIIANGSAQCTMADWKRDLMSRGASGTVWRVALGGTKPQATPLLRDVAFPYGLALAPDGSILIAEAWRHRVVVAGSTSLAQARILLADLPAYPSRIVPSEDGYWLALFAPRNQLIEFVLQEDAYRQKMIAGIDPDFWIAPSLASGVSFLEPIQGGARKKLNTLKPWSPSWSYGLVVHCDKSMRPLESFHSRADGHVHGVTSLCKMGNFVFAGAKGSGVIVAVDAR